MHKSTFRVVVCVFGRVTIWGFCCRVVRIDRLRRQYTVIKVVKERIVLSTALDMTSTHPEGESSIDRFQVDSPLFQLRVLHSVLPSPRSLNLTL